MREVILVFDTRYEGQIILLPVEKIRKGSNLKKFVDEITSFSHKTCDGFSELYNSDALVESMFKIAEDISAPYIVKDRIDLR